MAHVIASHQQFNYSSSNRRGKGKKAIENYSMKLSRAIALLVKTIFVVVLVDGILQAMNLFSSPADPNTMAFFIKQHDAYKYNLDVDLYLRKMVLSTNKRYKVSKEYDENKLIVKLDWGGEAMDVFQGAVLRWKLNVDNEVPGYELTFHKKHRNMVFNRYLPYIMEKTMLIRKGEKIINHQMLKFGSWTEEWLEHTASFDTVSMNHDLKEMLISDLDMYVKRKGIYRGIRKPWKRNYLLIGPLGTGNSSLIVAIANYIKFDIYNLHLSRVTNNTELRNYLHTTSNKSILLVEDIDYCTIEICNGENKERAQAIDTNGHEDNKISLSELFNTIDELWSSYGDERIIVFTTKHKDQLDPTLLRPGLIDMHVDLLNTID